LAREILTFGSSHWYAVRLAYTRLAAAAPLDFTLANFQIAAARYQPFHVGDPENPTFNEVFLNDLRTFVEDRRPQLVISIMGGADWVKYGLVNTPVPFDFILPNEPELPLIEGAEIIPYHAMRSMLAENVRRTYMPLRSIRAFTDLPLYHVAPPPPIRDSETVAALLGDNPFSKDFGAAIRQYGIPTRHLRYKSWRTFSDLVRETCSEVGCGFIDVPPESQDEEGFLREEYRAKDPVHANDAYGILVIRQLQALLPQPVESL